MKNAANQQDRTAFLLSLPRKKSNVFLLGWFSDTHFASQASRFATYGRIRSFSSQTSPGLYLWSIFLKASKINIYSNKKTKLIKERIDLNQFPVESISGRSQIAFFINLRTDLKDQGWWTGSMWSLPPERCQAGWSVTHFKASC